MVITSVFVQYKALQKKIKIEKYLTAVRCCEKRWGELDCNDVRTQFSHEWGKQENQTGKVLEQIKWKQNRNWLQCWGNGILRSSPGSLRA